MNHSTLLLIINACFTKRSFDMLSCHLSIPLQFLSCQAHPVAGINLDSRKFSGGVPQGADMALSLRRSLANRRVSPLQRV